MRKHRKQGHKAIKNVLQAHDRLLAIVNRLVQDQWAANGRLDTGKARTARDEERERELMINFLDGNARHLLAVLSDLEAVWPMTTPVSR